MLCDACHWCRSGASLHSCHERRYLNEYLSAFSEHEVTQMINELLCWLRKDSAPQITTRRAARLNKMKQVKQWPSPPSFWLKWSWSEFRMGGRGWVGWGGVQCSIKTGTNKNLTVKYLYGMQEAKKRWRQKCKEGSNLVNTVAWPWPAADTSDHL